MKRSLAAAILLLFSAISAQADNVTGKWNIVFAGGTSITQADANIVQTGHSLSSPFFSGVIADVSYQNYEVESDSSCSNTGWAQTQPTGTIGSGSDSTFSFTIPNDMGGSYQLTGTVGKGNKSITGTYTSDCNGDHGSFTATMYAQVSITVTGAVTGSSNAGDTSYMATLTLTEDNNFQVTGSITLKTPSGNATCYGTIPVFGPATGSIVELGGSNGSVQLINLLVEAGDVHFSSVNVDTLLLYSSQCGDDPISGTLGHARHHLGVRKK